MGGTPHERISCHDNLSHNPQSSYYQHSRRAQESCNGPKDKNRGRVEVQAGVVMVIELLMTGQLSTMSFRFERSHLTNEHSPIGCFGSNAHYIVMIP